jgi:hypothetical protein
MLSLVKLFAGLFKAFPRLADLFEDAVYHFRNASAEVHRTEKDNAVDAFIDSSNSGVSCDSVQWSGEVDEASRGEGGSEGSTLFHSGSVKGDKSP